MFYQATQANLNPLSPFRTKGTDPDAHAHSPRHANQAVLDSLFTTRELMPPPAFKASGMSFGDPFLPQYSQIHQDPFTEQSGPRTFPSRMNRKSSGSGDISMPERPPPSNEMDHSMPDYSRPSSPISSFTSLTMPELSRPTSPLNQSSGADSIVLSAQPDPSSRQTSKESLRGPNMKGFFDEADAFDAQSEISSQFNDMMETVSPRKLSVNVNSTNASARASSAANTPPPRTRPSAAAEARASSYAGMTRVTSNAGRSMELNCRRASEKIVGDRRESAQKQRETSGNLNIKGHDPVRKIPSDKIRGRKEGRLSEAGNEAKTKTDRSQFINLDEGSENPKSSLEGLQKRRRLSGPAGQAKGIDLDDNFDPDTPSKSKRHPEAGRTGLNNDKQKETARESSIIREPLGHLENKS